ncbi:MAG: dihydroorotase, partial [Bacillota bacterium]
IKNGKLQSCEETSLQGFISDLEISDKDSEIVIFPGFIDVHVHLREPGFFHKETIKTGTLAALSSGYTAVCSMPNVSPVPDSMENLQVQLDIINSDAVCEVYPYGALTKGENGKELVDFKKLAPYCVAFSDDGKGVQSQEVTRKAMIEVAKTGRIFAQHLEDDEIKKNGVIHDGEYAKKHNIPAIPSEAEFGMLARDLKLVRETGVKYHVCHLSTKEGVEMIRKAKAEGLDVTCETAPHYLVLTEADLKDEGNFKMNPPLRSKEDQIALIKGLQDGTIDMIATDHAPHAESEKAGGLLKSAMGIVGIETAFPLLYTHLVKTGILSLEKLSELLTTNPAKRFGINQKFEENYTVFDLNANYEIKAENFLSKGKNSPFIGKKVYAKCIKTVNGGNTWKANSQEN